MKIVYCITHMHEIGGAQIHVRDLALFYQKQGHEVHIICGSQGDIINDLKNSGITIHFVAQLKREISPLNDMSAVFKICKILKNIHPDIITCHSSKAGLLGRFAAWICGVPSVFTVHGWAFTEGIPKNTALVYRALEKWIAKVTSHIITVSQYDKDLALKYNVMPDEKMTVIHNGIHDIAYTRYSELHDSVTFRLLMVARFGAQKDHQLLLGALRNLTHLNWTLDLIGGGDFGHLIEFCKKNNMSERVRFLGQRNDVNAYYKSADVFLLISNWEGLPISILEAMREGLPVIASDVGGVREIVSHEVNGFLISRGNSSHLQNALQYLLTKVAEINRMGLESRKIYEVSFLFEQMANKTMEIYKFIQKQSPINFRRQ